MNKSILSLLLFFSIPINGNTSIEHLVKVVTNSQIKVLPTSSEWLSLKKHALEEAKKRCPLNHFPEQEKMDSLNPSIGMSLTGALLTGGITSLMLYENNNANTVAPTMALGVLSAAIAAPICHKIQDFFLYDKRNKFRPHYQKALAREQKIQQDRINLLYPEVYETYKYKGNLNLELQKKLSNACSRVPRKALYLFDYYNSAYDLIKAVQVEFSAHYKYPVMHITQQLKVFLLSLGCLKETLNMIVSSHDLLTQWEDIECQQLLEVVKELKFRLSYYLLEMKESDSFIKEKRQRQEEEIFLAQMAIQEEQRRAFKLKARAIQARIAKECAEKKCADQQNWKAWEEARCARAKTNLAEAERIKAEEEAELARQRRMLGQ